MKLSDVLIKWALLFGNWDVTWDEFLAEFKEVIKFTFHETSEEVKDEETK